MNSKSKQSKYYHRAKSVRIRSLIQSECGKKRARKTLNADTFCAVYQIRIQDLIIYQNGASSKIFERI